MQKQPLAGLPERVTGRRVERVFCKGKHIFVEFEGGTLLHNHLLMRGTWTRTGGQVLIPRDDMWASFYAGTCTVSNLRGQMLRIEDRETVEASLAELGPDLMAEPFPRAEIEAALRATPLGIGEAVLDQSVVAGAGNVARCEALFLAGVDPRVPATRLEAPKLAELVTALHSVMWESYRNRGRWVHRVYRKHGGTCPRCRGPIRSLRLPPSRRRIWFCPACQGGDTLGPGLPFEAKGTEKRPTRETR